MKKNRSGASSTASSDPQEKAGCLNATPSRYEEIVNMISADYSRLSAGFQKIARFFTQNPNVIALESINAIARQIGVSHCWEPLGEPMLVTSSTGNAVSTPLAWYASPRVLDFQVSNRCKLFFKHVYQRPRRGFAIESTRSKMNCRRILIAEILGISETNVATRISRIKDKLKQKFSALKK